MVALVAGVAVANPDAVTSGAAKKATRALKLAKKASQKAKKADQRAKDAESVGAGAQTLAAGAQAAADGAQASADQAGATADEAGAKVAGIAQAKAVSAVIEPFTEQDLFSIAGVTVDATCFFPGPDIIGFVRATADSDGVRLITDGSIVELTPGSPKTIVGVNAVDLAGEERSFAIQTGTSSFSGIAALSAAPSSENCWATVQGTG